MNITANFEHRAGSSQSKHEGEPSFALCDRLSRIRDNSQRQLPTDHDYAVPTREYQTDQSSLNLPRLLLALSSRKSNYKDTRRLRRVDTVTPYQGNALIHSRLLPQIGLIWISGEIRAFLRRSGQDKVILGNIFVPSYLRSLRNIPYMACSNFLATAMSACRRAFFRPRRLSKKAFA